MGRQRISGTRRTDTGSQRTNTGTQRTNTGSWRARLAGGALLVCLGTTATALPKSVSARAQDGGAPTKYVLAGATGATLRNLPDPKGRDVLRVAGDTPLAVYAEREGNPFMKVAAPGGIKVWVFGRYLTESARPGWVEVSGSYINMRPRPQTQNSYPLGQLDRGDRLRFISRQDPSKPLSEDWVQVYSPPDTMAYVLAAETRALPAGADPAALWKSSVKATLDSRADVAIGGALLAAGASNQAKSAATTNPGNAGGANSSPISNAAPSSNTGAQNAGIFAKFAAANTAMDTSLAQGNPDYDALYGNYQAVLALGPDAPTRSLIEERIKRLDLHRDLAQMRNDLESEKVQRQERLDGLRDQVQSGQNSNDPLWGRFQTRGWLERQERNGEKIYLVRWGANFVAQVQCSSRRYDLDLYDAFEIGIQGVPVTSARVETGAYPLVDVDRIEVISARLRER